MEAIGASSSCQASRDHLIYTVEAPRTFVPQALEIMCDTIANPAFDPEDVAAAKKSLERENDLVKNDPRLNMLEELQRYE